MIDKEGNFVFMFRFCVSFLFDLYNFRFQQR